MLGEIRRAADPETCDVLMADQPGRDRPSPNSEVLGRVRAIPLFALVTLGYGLLAILGEAILLHDRIAALWPAAGFSAVMLLWAGSLGRRMLVLLGVALGIGLSIAARGMVFPNELGYLVANLVEPVVMLPFLVRATPPSGRMDRLSSLVWLVVGAALSTAVAGAVVASMATWSFDGTGDFAGTWPGSWLAFTTGDLLGMLLIAPLMLQAQPVRRIWSRGSAREQALLWSALITALLLSWAHPVWLVAGLVVVLVIALRLDPSAASLAVFALISLQAAESLSERWLAIHDSLQTADARAALPMVALLTQLVSLGTNERISAQEGLAQSLKQVRRSAALLASVAGSAPFGTALFDMVPGPPGSPPRFHLAFSNAVGRPDGALDPDRPGGPDLGNYHPDLVGQRLSENLMRAWADRAEHVITSESSGLESIWAGVQEIHFLPVGDDQVMVSWSDITQLTWARRDAEAAHLTAEASAVTLRRALDTGLDAFAIYRRGTNGGWGLVFVNGLGASHSGATPRDLVGTAPERVVPVEALAQVLPLMELAHFTQAPQKTVADSTGNRDGWRGDFDIMASPIPDNEVVVTWRDVTEIASTHRDLRSAHAAAMHAATHDPLTNLPNRSLLLDRMKTALALLPLTSERLALVCLAIDDLETINDRYGHEVGDAVLVKTGELCATWWAREIPRPVSPAMSSCCC